VTHRRTKYRLILDCTKPGCTERTVFSYDSRGDYEDAHQAYRQWWKCPRHRPRHQSIAVVASAPSCCAPCGGAGEVQLRAVPEGGWVKARCPHCYPSNGLPIFPLPWHQDTERNTA